jgi:NitT/TauT family transport system substrate-binding protein
VTRALLKAAKWVGENQQAASDLSIDKNYVPSSENIREINTQALLKLNYTPGVSKCRKSVDSAAEDMKESGLLKPETDPKALAQKVWLDLDGVNDEWVNGLKVEQAAAGRPALLNPVEFAALFNGRKSCCGACCCIGGE